MTTLDQFREKHPEIRADFTIDQHWERYGAPEHGVWRTLYERQAKVLPGRACGEFLDGLNQLKLVADRIPNFEEMSDDLERITGWRVVAVPSLVPDEIFFDHLANKRFPAGQFIRRPDQLDYIEEPDVFHDVFGHVPMHAHRVFAGFLEHYGRVCAAIEDAGVLEKLGRLFWYTVEFGLIRQGSEIKAYGSGVISSHGECQNVFSGGCAVRHFSLDEILETPVKVDELQKVLFAVESFDQIYEAMYDAEQRARNGRL
jgi:phenylalanine-4-hydroxylase